jgi:hypothetical protein
MSMLAISILQTRTIKERCCATKTQRTNDPPMSQFMFGWGESLRLYTQIPPVGVLSEIADFTNYPSLDTFGAFPYSASRVRLSTDWGSRGRDSHSL